MSTPAGATVTTIIKVTAPADLQEGCTFDASAEGKTFKVTVPKGGVRAGDDIEIPMPKQEGEEEERFALSTSTTKQAREGCFKVGLFDCFEACPGPFLMAFFCPGIFAGQIFQRLKYNIIGIPTTATASRTTTTTTAPSMTATTTTTTTTTTNSSNSNTCTIMTIIFVFAWILTIILLAVTSGPGVVIWYAFYLYIVVALTLARYNFRTKYKIPTKLFDNDDFPEQLDDCCCACFCGCCTLIQMHRHTHDEQLYPYDFKSPTGLPSNAPEIV